MDPAYRLVPEKEKQRYEEHNNDITDAGYRKFVSPVTERIQKNFSSANRGLDFGAGTGPVISAMLAENGYNVEIYDPFFAPDASKIEEKYDYIACCEVIEHFYDPKKEFALLRSMLAPGGQLFCMTLFYDEKTDFSKWFYKNDPTHVVFYHKKTIEYIKDEFDFASAGIHGRLAVFNAG